MKGCYANIILLSSATRCYHCFLLLLWNTGVFSDLRCDQQRKSMWLMSSYHIGLRVLAHTVH